MTVNAITGGTQRCAPRRRPPSSSPSRTTGASRRRPAVATTKRRLEAAQNTTRTPRVGEVAAARRRHRLGRPEVVPADARLLVAEDSRSTNRCSRESLPVDKQVDPVRSTSKSGEHAVRGSTIVGARSAIVVAPASIRRTSGDLGRRGRRNGAGVQARLKELTSKVLPLTLTGGAAVSALALLRAQRCAKRRRRVAIAVRPSRRAAVGGYAVSARRRPAPDGARSAGPFAAHHRALAGSTHMFRQDRHSHRKPATRRLRHTAHGQPQDSFPDASDPQSAAVLTAAAFASPSPKRPGHAHATDEAIITAASSLITQSDSGWTVLAEVRLSPARFAARSAPEHKLRFTGPDTQGRSEYCCGVADSPIRTPTRARGVVGKPLADQGCACWRGTARLAERDTEDEETDADASCGRAGPRAARYVGLADTAAHHRAR